jgi:hypothetical protein
MARQSTTRYALHNPEGLYLNTDYHGRYIKGIWRPRKDLRVYKSKTGMRSAIRGDNWAIALIPTHRIPEKRMGKYWEGQQKESIMNWGEILSGISKIPDDEFFSYLEKGGYILEELAI